MDSNECRTEFVTRMGEILSHSVSEAGKDKFNHVIGIIGGIIETNFRTISARGEIPGFIINLIKDAYAGECFTGMAMIDGDDDKDQVLKDISIWTDETSFDAVVTVSEAWMSPSRGDTSKIQFRPRDDPERKEVVITMTHLNIAYKPCLITVIHPIIRRSDKTTILGGGEVTVAYGDEVKGRMTGFEKNLLAIT